MYVSFIFGALYHLSKFLCDDIAWRRTEKIRIADEKFRQTVCADKI